MFCSSQGYVSNINRRLVRFAPVFWLLPTFAILSAVPCQAASTWNAPELPIPDATDWVSGPATADLGSVGQIKVPAGYKFRGISAARSFLDKQNVPAGDNLLGILSPDAGGWWMTFQSVDCGFVKVDEKTPIDEPAMLKSIREQVDRENQDRVKRGLEALNGVEWELKPAFNKDSKIVEWAVRVGGQPGGLVSHTVRLLGRKGVVDATTVRAYRGFTDLLPLKGLVKGVAFKEGQAYADFKAGDKIASGGLTDLAAGSLSLRETKESANAKVAVAATEEKKSSSLWSFWIVIGLVGLTGAAGGSALALKRTRNRKVLKAQSPQAPEPAAQQPTTQTAVVPARPAILARKIAAQARPKPASAPRLQPLVKAVNGHAHKNGAKKRRIFNYHKFYTEMVLQVSPSTRAESTYEGYLPEMARHVNGSPHPEPVIEHSHAGNGNGFAANSEMISHQKMLIEEQKRLIEEQTRLIAEKTKLIEEKNQLLRRQSEMIDNNLI